MALQIPVGELQLEPDEGIGVVSDGAPKPLRVVWRGVLLVFGTLMLALGVIGIYLPGLPTTPFVLLAAACYVRSSERLYGWLVHHPRLGPHLHTFLEQKALPLEVKVFSFILGWLVLGGLVLFIVQSTILKVVLLAVAVIKTVVMLSIKTLPQQRSGRI